MITFSGFGDDPAPPQATLPASVASMVSTPADTASAIPATDPTAVDPTASVPIATPISDADAFLLQVPAPTCSDIVSFLKPYWPHGGAQSDRALVAQELVAKGVPQATVTQAMQWLTAAAQHSNDRNQLYGWLAVVSAAASAFHGYRRNKSIGWALVWFVAGGIFPVVTPVLALAQGFGQPKGS